MLKWVGVELPDDLILVHEFGDHYSLQAGKDMTVDGMLYYVRPIEEELMELLELNAKITRFLATKGECLTVEAWLERYPHPTERA